MTLKEIVTWYVKTRGFDGLGCEECGCLVDDLFPCVDGFDMTECKPGYRVPCDCGNWCSYHISPIREVKND
jgi:hypothetical protein